MALQAQTKREKRFVAKGRSEARASMRERAKSEALVDKATTYFGAWAGQKWLGGMMTPGLGTIPLHYSIGAVFAVLELGGQVGRTRSGRMICSAVDGLVAGQLGVQGFANQTPLFGG